MAREPKFPIGTKFKTRGKAPRLCIVIDILRTFNANGNLVRVRYVAAHEFLGQTITEEVVETTVAMGIGEVSFANCAA